MAGRVTEVTIPFPPGSSALRGTITRRDGTPVADTIVAVTGCGSSADHGAQKTDARGAFGFESLPAGLYRLSVGGPRYSSVSAWADLGENEAKNVQIEVGVPAMTGIVTEAASGAPVRGPEESLQGRVVVRGSSDDRGEYRIDDVPPGPYRLVASCEGFGFRSLGERQIGADMPGDPGDARIRVPIRSCRTSFATRRAPVASPGRGAAAPGAAKTNIRHRRVPGHHAEPCVTTR